MSAQSRHWRTPRWCNIVGPKSKAESKKMPKAMSAVVGPKSKAESKKMPKAMSAAVGPKSTAESVVDGPRVDRSEVRNPEAWKMDNLEWVQRHCWVCTSCSSMNVRCDGSGRRIGAGHKSKLGPARLV